MFEDVHLDNLKEEIKEEVKEEKKVSKDFVVVEEKEEKKSDNVKDENRLITILKQAHIPQLNKNKNMDEIFFHVVKPTVMKYLIATFIGFVYAVEIFK
jgi:hypothetical protein